MKTIRLVLASLALLLVCGTAQAQFGKWLGNAIKKSAENATVRKAEQKTDEAVGKAIDKATDPDTYKEEGKEAENDSQKASTKKQSGNVGEDAETSADETPADTPQQGVKAAEMAYAKSDFVPGDEIIFEDLLTGEQLGEFPSQWDVLHGSAEIASINGENAILFIKTAEITPLMKAPKNYLPELYTIEFDWYVRSKKNITGFNNGFSLHLRTTDKSDVLNLEFPCADVYNADEGKKLYNFRWNWRTSDGEYRNGDVSDVPLTTEAWHHMAISFNKRAMKIYVNGTRITNIPSIKQANWMYIHGNLAGDGKNMNFIKNIRIAQGAVPLYDRMMTDGKFITYGITFDVGKSVIKPESMGEINRIVTLMKDNPDLKFSVEGHTDATGNAASNQTLSEARAAAIVAKLVEMGVAKERLQSAGKGQNSPIADNSTDEGRAKNRRVEFVKID
jgi:outer membrane protein OmpA-like peptidoglycan-associated protein